MDQQTNDPIAECHRLGIAIRVDQTDTRAALDAWEQADDAEAVRVLTACMETVTGLAEDVLAKVLPRLWPERAVSTSDLRTLLEPHAIQYLAREHAARYALAANRRMSLPRAA